MAGDETRDLPLLLCRVAFVFALVGLVLMWPQISAENRFYALVVGVAAGSAVSLSSSFRGLCSTLIAFGAVVVVLSLFTIFTGYSPGRFRTRVVEPSSGIPPLVAGVLLVGTAWTGRRFVQRT